MKRAVKRFRFAKCMNIIGLLYFLIIKNKTEYINDISREIERYTTGILELKKDFISALWKEGS